VSNHPNAIIDLLVRFSRPACLPTCLDGCLPTFGVITIDDPSLQQLVVWAANNSSTDVDISSLATRHLFDPSSTSPVAISQHVVPYRHPLQGHAAVILVSEPPQLLVVDLLYLAVDAS
jgi:hypothetical protein